MTATLFPAPFSPRRRLDLASLLNEAQLRAATHPGGPLLIVAGAGSGKTRTLVHRVAWLVDQGADPKAVLLLTFTRKAAAEMLGRCEELVGERAGRVSGGTFHTLANSLLRRHAHLLGYSSSFTILDQGDSETLVARARADELGKSAGRAQFPKRSAILGLISQAVNREMAIEALIKKFHPHLSEYSSKLARIRDGYVRLKKEGNQMDFDDLLVNLEAVMRENEDARKSIAGRYCHVLVDEYQDTNSIQARLTKLLGSDHGNVTAVGDEAQSIYSFRGADFRNIMAFPSVFPGATVIKLEDNYRSRPQVLEVANHLLSQAKDSFKKILRPNRESGPKPKVILAENLNQEASEVLERITALKSGGVPLSDIAVLFRAASHSFELEAALAREAIPFSKFGGRKFAELPHVKDFLSLLRLSANPSDQLSLARVLGLIQGLGPKSVEALVAHALEREGNHLSLHEARLPTKKASAELAALSDLLGLLARADVGHQAKAKLASDWCRGKLEANYHGDSSYRQRDLDEVKGMAFAAPDMDSFLAQMALDPPSTLVVGPSGKGGKRDDLTLSTIHSAKGLEWPHVFIISAVDGRFPSPYVRGEAGAEEELRLMYVAVTRAKDELTITVPLGFPAAGPMPMGSPWGSEDKPPSKFLAGLTSQDVRVYRWGGLLKDDEPLGRQKERSEKDFFEPPEDEPVKTLPAKDWGAAPKGHVPKAGELVRHPFFGIGRVLRATPTTAVIDFEHNGRKSVMIHFAKLILLGG